MRKAFILSFVVLLTGMTYAKEFNSLRPRYTPFPVNSKGEAIDCESLNGIWSFKPEYSEGFETKTVPDAAWKSIEVPGEWVMQGLPVKRNTSAGYSKGRRSRSGEHLQGIGLAIEGISCPWVRNSLFGGESALRGQELEQ
ncbi:MAG: hypothetical protein ISS35_07890, partial [Kiritimatiellae bacterium]|nr:hypothetical protein [Kiritimatiellia bacterium]